MIYDVAIFAVGGLLIGLPVVGATLLIVAAILRLWPTQQSRALAAVGVALLGTWAVGGVLLVLSVGMVGYSASRPADGYYPPDDTGYSDPALEAAMATLRRMPVLWNKPESLPFGRSTQISAIVASRSLDAAESELKAFAGATDRTDATLSRTVRATLTGPKSDVDIELIGKDDERTLVRSSNAQWIWDVTPKRPGTATLTLTIYNRIEVDGEVMDVEGPPPLRATFKVKMGVLDWLAYWLGKIDPIRSSIVGLVATIAAGGAWLTARPLLGGREGRAPKPAEAAVGPKAEPPPPPADTTPPQPASRRRAAPKPAKST